MTASISDAVVGTDWLAEHLDDLVAGHFRHHDVENDGIGFQGARLGHGLAATERLRKRRDCRQD